MPGPSNAPRQHRAIADTNMQQSNEMVKASRCKEQNRCQYLGGKGVRLMGRQPEGRWLRSAEYHSPGPPSVKPSSQQDPIP
eukprot:2170497-Rhodomonas_salina.1